MAEERRATPVQPVVAWRGENLRFTAFPAHSDITSETSLWQSIVGEAPDVRTVDRRSGVVREEGPFSGSRLVIAASASRIDILLNAAASENAADILSTFDFEATLDAFVEVITNWLNADGENIFHRIALGAVLLQPVESREAGYRRLQRYLPAVQLDPAGSSDFFYQINRPRTSGEARVNRLSRWSVAVLGLAALTISSESASVAPVTSAHVCRLELDINTMPGLPAELDRERATEVLRVLNLLARELADRGDIP